MLRAAWVVIFGCLTISSELSFANDASNHRCAAVSTMRDVVASHNGTWTELSTEEWQFLRGVYAMNPGARGGLPYGSTAALAQVSGYPDGLVFFIDGDQTCTSMKAPPELLLLMYAVRESSPPSGRGSGR